MRLKEEFAKARRRFDLLSFYEKFEQIVIFILTVLIAVFVIFATWNLALKVLQSIASSTLDPTDYAEACSLASSERNRPPIGGAIPGFSGTLW